MTDLIQEPKTSFAHHYGDQHPHQKRTNLGLTLGALGVVYGDIGTSPIYTLRECFTQSGAAVDPLNVYGFLSLVFWALTFVVSFKYVYFLMQANNRGEGGIMALAALTLQATTRRPRLKHFIFIVATLGLALFYGDGIITPAISVLSAVEGLKTFSPYFADLVLPIALVLLIGLFAAQKLGTRLLGHISGPVMFVWFLTLGALGFYQISQMPDVLVALNPYYGLAFLLTHGYASFLAIGAVVLCITGAEAIYSDMGHFGPKPIRQSWHWVVYPGLVLNYFGQGALLLANPAAINDPFFNLVPEAGILPLVGLATLATIIASQAVITGAFSLSNQAIQVGLLPRLNVRHTDAHHRGQIYVPQINWLLMIGVIILVLSFRSSGAMAEMYGVSVTGTMLATSILILLVMKYIWRKSWLFAGAIGGLFIAVDLLLFGSTLLKVHHGGYVSLLIAGGIFIIMMTWRRGRELVMARRRGISLSLPDLLSQLDKKMPHRVPGTAIYMAFTEDTTPYPLLYNLGHNKVLHECVLLLTVRTEDRPHVPAGERLLVAEERHGVWHIIIRYGFMERPNVMDALRHAKETGLLKADIDHASFFIGRDRLVMGTQPVMSRWRMRLFFWLAHNAVSPTDYYRLPPGHVLEVGTQVAL